MNVGHAMVLRVCPIAIINLNVVASDREVPVWIRVTKQPNRLRVLELVDPKYLVCWAKVSHEQALA